MRTQLPRAYRPAANRRAAATGRRDSGSPKQHGPLRAGRVVCD